MTTFSLGPDGISKVAKVVFFTDKSPTETLETAPGQDIGEMLRNEFAKRTRLTVRSCVKEEKKTFGSGKITYTLKFEDGTSQVVTVLLPRFTGTL